MIRFVCNHFIIIQGLACHGLSHSLVTLGKNIKIQERTMRNLLDI